MRRAWRRWRRRQRSALAYALVPGGTRLTQSGRLVENSRPVLLEVQARSLL